MENEKLVFSQESLETFVNEVKSYTDEKLSSKSDSGHNHNDTYYTETEIDTKTTNLQLEIDGKANKDHTHSIEDVINLQSTLDGKANSSHNHAASNITSGTLSIDRLPTVPVEKGGTGSTTATGALTNLGITATASELNKLDGVTATTAELNYIDGVTSNVQTQLDSKFNKSGGTVSSDLILDNGATGTTPSLVFQRGTLTDNYNDWRINDSAGHLCIEQRGNGSTSWQQIAKFIQGGFSIMNGSTSKITLSSDGSISATSFSGNAATATTASKLGTESKGSATQPIYLNAGTPTACTYTLSKSVPSDAKFTDTTYTSLKNPYSLTIQGNGTTLTNGTYDGSAAKTINITPASIGAATSSHAHHQLNNSQGGYVQLLYGSDSIYHLLPSHTTNLGSTPYPFNYIYATGLIATSGITVGGTNVSLDGHTHSQYYNIDTSRTANHVLAAPNGSDGGATFRALVAADIPNLNASKINAGTFSTDRIPNLNASKINAGTFSTDRIPNLDASKITSGTLSSDRLPTVSIAKGGTGATTAAAARTNLGITPANIGAATSGHNHDSAYLKLTGGTLTGNLTVPGLTVSTTRPIMKPVYETTVSYATNMYVGSNGGIVRTTTTSSKFIKHDIKKLEDGTDLSANNLYDIDVMQFKYNDDIITDKNDCRYKKDLVGFIIEQLNEVYPIAVDKATDDTKNWSWNAQYLIPPMLKLIQEQKQDIDGMKAEITYLKTKIES